ncbi:hypothetical protein HDU86_001550 [Geranomyces michiganensis]|nr:hypothetical protein HDU86_001550 [Geranomyces michiganensis]
MMLPEDIDVPDADLGAGDVAATTPVAGKGSLPSVVQLDPIDTAVNSAGDSDGWASSSRPGSAILEMGASEEDIGDLVGAGASSSVRVPTSSGQSSAPASPARSSTPTIASTAATAASPVKPAIPAAARAASPAAVRRQSLETATIDKFIPSPKLSENASIPPVTQAGAAASSLPPARSPHSESSAPVGANPADEALDATFARLLAMGFEAETCELAIAESLANKELAGAASPALLDMAVAFIVSRMGEGDSGAVRGVSFEPSQRRPPLHPPRGILKASTPSGPPPSLFSRFAKQMDTAADALANSIEKMKPILRNLSMVDLEDHEQDDDPIWASRPSSAGAASGRSPRPAASPVAGSEDLSGARHGSTSSSHHSLLGGGGEKHVRFSFPDIHAVGGPPSPALTDDGGTRSPAWDVWDSPLDQAHAPLSLPRAGTDDVSPTSGGGSPTKTRVTTPDALYAFYQTRCSLRNEQMVDRVGDQIRRAIVAGSEVTELDFKDVVISSRNVASVAELLATSYAIPRISFEGATLDDETIKPILTALILHDNVVHLCLRNTKKVRGAGLKYLSVYIKKSRKLKTLDVSGIPFDHRAISYLAHALREGGQLGSLRMDGCEISAALLRVLGTALVESNVTSLTLRANRLTWEAGPALADILLGVDAISSYVVRGLTSLDVSDNNLGRGITPLSSALGRNRRLTELSICRNAALDARDLAALAAALRTNETLESLDLSGTGVDGEGGAGVAALKDAVAGNRTLKTLGLAAAGLTTEGAIALAEALPLTTTLRKLDLRENPLDLAGAMAIAMGMKMNRSIVELEIAPVLRKGGHGLDDNPDLASFINDVSMYCQRNSEIQLAQPTASPTSPTARSVTSSMSSISGGIDAGRLVADIKSATETATLLEQMLGVSDSPRDVVRQLYDQTRSFQKTLQDLVAETVGLDEELLMQILTANDVLLSATAAYDKHETAEREDATSSPASAAAPPTALQPQASNSSRLNDSYGSLLDMDADGEHAGPSRLTSELEDQMKEIDAFLDDEDDKK